MGSPKFGRHLSTKTMVCFSQVFVAYVGIGVDFLTASSFFMILENENNGLWTELMNFISADLDMNIVFVAFVKYLANVPFG